MSFPVWLQIAAAVGAVLLLPYAFLFGVSRLPIGEGAAKAGSIALPAGTVLLVYWVYGGHGELAERGDLLGGGLVLCAVGTACLLRLVTVLLMKGAAATARDLGLEHSRSFPNDEFRGLVRGIPTRVTRVQGDAETSSRWVSEFELPAPPGADLLVRRNSGLGQSPLVMAFLARRLTTLTLPVEDLGRGLARQPSPPGWEKYSLFCADADAARRLSRTTPAAAGGRLYSLRARDGRMSVVFVPRTMSRGELDELARAAQDVAARLA